MEFASFYCLKNGNKRFEVQFFLMDLFMLHLRNRSIDFPSHFFRQKFEPTTTGSNVRTAVDQKGVHRTLLSNTGGLRYSHLTQKPRMTKLGPIHTQYFCTQYCDKKIYCNKKIKIHFSSKNFPV